MLDHELLAEARAAGARAVGAERDAEVAKADYHHAIRRLQLAGGTMREIADALGLSHQRVQQIVDASGGGRRWRRRTSGAAEALACSFCGREQRKVKKLVAGPGIYICDRCIRASRRITEGQTPDPSSTLVATGTGDSVRCGFCGKARRKVRQIVAAPRAPMPAPTKGKFRSVAICNECLDLCGEIVAQPAGSAAAGRCSGGES